MLTIVEVSNFDPDPSPLIRMASRSASGAGPSGAGVRRVIVAPDRGSWTESHGRELLVEHLEAPLWPGSRSQRALLRAAPLRDVIQLHRPAAVVCASPVLLPALVHLAIQRLDPRPALIGRWQGDAAEVLRGGLERAVLERVGLVEPGLRAAAWWSKQSFASFDAVLVGSRELARQLFAGGLERIYYVPPGVELELFSPSRRAPAWVAELRAGRERPIIGLVCPAETEAAIVRRIHGALCRRLPLDPALVIVTRGQGSARLERFAAGSAHVHPCTDADADARARALAACDLGVVLPGLDGGASACAELMACGRPVVLAGGVGEQVRDAGCGRVLPRAREAIAADAIAAATVELLRSDELDQIGQRGRRFIEAFDLDSCVERELVCCREIIEHVRAGRRVPAGIHERMQPEALSVG